MYTREWFDDFDRAASVEFTLTGGAGAYTTTTVCGANTRRYHALLAARLAAPKGTFVMLSALEEALEISGARVFLSTAEYPGAVFPQGHAHQESFELDGRARSVFEVAGVRLKKTVAMSVDTAAVIVTYELLTAKAGVKLFIRPLCAFRETHQLARANPDGMVIAETDRKWVRLQPYSELPALSMHFPGEFVHEPSWYKNVLYRRDRERGHWWEEDLLTPGYFEAELKAGKPVSFLACVGEDKRNTRQLVSSSNKQWWTFEGAPDGSGLVGRLAAGFGDFIVLENDSAGILRGLPWHNQWSRNALMALPALPALGRPELAQAVLAGWARRASAGLLPRFLDERGGPGPADLEGTLWFFEAVENYLAHTKNYEWVEEVLLPFMTGAIEAIAAGGDESRPGEDGLMYSRADARALAPGGPPWRAFVEIQALYFNALKVMEGIRGHFRDGKAAHDFHERAKPLQKAYNALMWDAEGHVPVDSYTDGAADVTPRPMCLLAVALSHPVLIRRRWEVLLDMVGGALLTPLGLRGAPLDTPGMKRTFPGDSFEDARRYGGIWPQFLGAYLTAYAKTFGRSEKWAGEIEEYLRPLEAELDRGMIDHLPEFFDSIEPFTGRGAPADAAAAGQLIWAFSAEVNPRHYGGEEA